MKNAILFSAKSAIIAILIIILTGQVFATPVAPIKADSQGNYGFIDAEGKLTITAQFEDAGRFSQGFAPVYFEGAWFFIDEKGANSFARAFSEAKGFSEGLAAVKENELWGYIDLSGKMVIACQFEEAYPFSEGLACVQTGKKEDGSARYGYIDKTGKFVIEPVFAFYDNQYFSWPTEFSEGFASAWMENKDGQAMVGYFDKTGKTMIKPAFIEGGQFCQGLAPVHTSDELAGGARFIKKDGSFAFSKEFARTGRFNNGLAPVSLLDSGEGQASWTFVNLQGEVAFKDVFSFVEPFENGIARVFIEDFTNEGYIDVNGRIICTTRQLTSGEKGFEIKYLSPDGVNSSSFLPPAKSGKTDYKPENACDGDSNTAWIEGKAGDGAGEWLEFLYEAECRFSKINFLSGYHKISAAGKSSFAGNLRPKLVKISNEKSDFVELTLADTQAEQSFAIDLTGHNLKITILSVYRTGKEDPDCGFSEISLFGSY